MQLVKAECATQGIEYKLLKNPCELRWEGEYDLIESVMHLISVIQILDDDGHLSEKAPENHHWKMLKGGFNILNDFKKTTRLWESDKAPSINEIVARLHFHEFNLTKFLQSYENSNHGLGFARALRESLRKRFPNCGVPGDI